MPGPETASSSGEEQDEDDDQYQCSESDVHGSSFVRLQVSKSSLPPSYPAQEGLNSGGWTGRLPVAELVAPRILERQPAGTVDVLRTFGVERGLRALQASPCRLRVFGGQRKVHARLVGLHEAYPLPLHVHLGDVRALVLDGTNMLEPTDVAVERDRRVDVADLDDHLVDGHLRTFRQTGQCSGIVEVAFVNFAHPSHDPPEVFRQRLRPW